MKSIVMDNKPKLLENKDFQTIVIKVMFPFVENNDTLAKEHLLPNMLKYMNNKYPSEEKFSIARRNLYILNSSCWRTVIGDDGCFSFNFIIPDVYSLRKDILDEQFEFFRDFIYNPLIINGGFNEFELEREKKNIKTAMGNAMKRMQAYHSIKLKKIIDNENTAFSRDLIYNQELLDDVTPQNLYQYYLDNIYNNQPVIYVFGNINKKRVTDLCNKYLFRKKFENKTIKVKLDYFLKPRKKVLEIEENSAFKDSAISFIYKVKDMKDEDEYYLNLVRDLLTSLSSRLLSKKLRDENELVYSDIVNSYPHFGLLEITCYINIRNVDLVKKKVFEVIEELKNPNFFAQYLENLKRRNRLNLIKRLDNKLLLFDDFIISDLGIHESDEEYYKKVEKIEADEIVRFMDRLVLDTIYFLKEEEHE